MASAWASLMQSQVHLIPLCQLGYGVTVYGFRYPGLLNCLSWCYLTIAKNVVIATQPENDCGTSLTNTWSKAFFELLQDLPPIKAAGQGRTGIGSSTTTSAQTQRSMRFFSMSRGG